MSLTCYEEIGRVGRVTTMPRGCRACRACPRGFYDDAAIRRCYVETAAVEFRRSNVGVQVILTVGSTCGGWRSTIVRCLSW